MYVIHRRQILTLTSIVRLDTWQHEVHMHVYTYDIQYTYGSNVCFIKIK